MIKLHGLSVSNYSSMVKFALLEKKIDYEWVETNPFSLSKDEKILEKTTLGAVPYLEHDGKFLSETFAIFEFLEKKFPHNRLISEDPIEASRTVEVMKILELYIEHQARPFYPFVFLVRKTL